MRYKITKDIIDTIQKAVGDEWGGIKRFADKTKVHSSTICDIIHGNYPAVQEDTWRQLCNSVPALIPLGREQEIANGIINAPVAITSGANSPATATVGDCSRDCAACRARLRQKVLSSGMDPSAMVAFLKMIEEAK